MNFRRKLPLGALCIESPYSIAGLPGANEAADIPRPYNAARQYPQTGQLRTPAHVWLPWDVLEDVVGVSRASSCLRVYTSVHCCVHCCNCPDDIVTPRML